MKQMKFVEFKNIVTLAEGTEVMGVVYTAATEQRIRMAWQTEHIKAFYSSEPAVIGYMVEVDDERT